MKWTARCLKSSLLALVLCYCTLAQGTSIEEFQTSGHLQINAALTPEEGIVPGQRVRLTLELATDTWFTGGTRIGIPEVPGLVILQTEQFASNASETRNGQTWVIQRWTLDVFPQRSGVFVIEPIPLKLQVNAGDGGDVKGEVRSPTVRFSVAIPKGLATVDQWVAATQFAVTQRFDRALDDLVVGDAFEQEILLEASDVLAMMLPTYEVDQQAGLAAYPSPPVLENNTNRGQSKASRSIRISYVVEQPGQYLLSARDFFWWNTQRGELALLSLPETRINVAGVGVSQRTTSAALSYSPMFLLILAVSLALLAAAGRLAYVYLPRLPWTRASMQLSALAHRWRTLRKPALATQLNPGSNAGDKTVTG